MIYWERLGGGVLVCTCDSLLATAQARLNLRKPRLARKGFKFQNFSDAVCVAYGTPGLSINWRCAPAQHVHTHSLTHTNTHSPQWAVSGDTECVWSECVWSVCACVCRGTIAKFILVRPKEVQGHNRQVYTRHRPHTLGGMGACPPEKFWNLKPPVLRPSSQSWLVDRRCQFRRACAVARSESQVHTRTPPPRRSQ